MTKKSNDRIPSEELTAYERWELPLLDQDGRSQTRVEQGEQRVKPLTASDLEEIHRQAFEDGHQEGLEAGTKKGLDQGAREGYKLGYDEGYAAGREDGQEKGLQESRTQVEERLARLDGVMAALLNPTEKQEDAVHAALLNLTMAVVRSVIQRELTMDSHHIGQLVRQAIKALPDPDQQLRIRVNPVDLEDVKSILDRHHSGARLEGDESIMAGGCQVENSHSLVDFTVEKRFQKAVQRMLDQKMAEPGDDSDDEELGALMGEMSDYHREVMDSPVSTPADSHEPGVKSPEPETADKPGTTESPDESTPPESVAGEQTGPRGEADAPDSKDNDTESGTPPSGEAHEPDR
ncbi:MAG: FliH/SctL family protein [Oleiphilaceae bacterium]|nr:FliH/SctL family protein [Oleiphilaceae bacterium]